MDKEVKVLFISPEFYQYTNAIIDELNKKNIKTTFYPWWPHLSLFKKYFFKKKEKNRRKTMDKYLSKILEETKGQDFSLILLNSTIYFSKDQIKRLLDAFPNAKKVFFMWDTIINYPVCESYIGLFDKFYSFDKTDCEKYNLIYRPDYCDPSLLNKQKSDLAKDIDLFFIGSVDPFRYTVIKNAEKYCNDNGLTYKFGMFFRSKLIYKLNKMVHKEFRKSKTSEFIFAPISPKEKDELFARSKVMLEIPRERQNGMSMRSIESQMLSMKMATTQDAIKLYDLYDENNVVVISKDDFSSLTKEFINGEYKNLDKAILDQYTPESCVKTVILDNLK